MTTVTEPDVGTEVAPRVGPGPDPVTVAREGAVAVVTFSNPPGNAPVAQVRAGMLLALAETEADRTVRAVVLRGAGGLFVAGDDLTVFDRQPQPPVLPDIVRAIEQATKPWIAAIEGAAVAGGLELALGCHYRIATPDARLSLPYVQFGLMPGAGGVVRICRLVAPLDALALVAEGKPVTGVRARELGLVDAIAEEDVLVAAIAFAAEAPRRELPLPLAAHRPLGEIDAAFEAAAAGILARARGQVAPAEAIAAIRDTVALHPHDAFAAERHRFLALLAGPQSPALRHIARAEQAIATFSPAVLPTATVAVLGGGTLGAGIATATLLAGRRVILIERADEALARGFATIRANLEDSLKRGLIDAHRHVSILADLAGATDYAALAEADLVIEAVSEDFASKSEVFAALDRATRPEAILATTTSHLDLNRIAASVADPGRVVGLHFFAPADVTKLVEVVRPASVRPEVFQTAVAFARDLGKVPVESGVCDGFIGNRILTRYLQAMDILLLEGALPWEIDAAMEVFGMAIGPYAAEDLSGLDVAWAGRQRMNVHARDDWAYVPIADRMVEEAKRLGRKTGAGWYDYADGKVTPAPAVEALIRNASFEAGIRRRIVPEAEIRRRALAAMVQEATHLLEEGIAARPSDIDLVLVHGCAFPRWKGGPMHWADVEGPKVVAATIAGFAVRDPRTWHVPPLLRRLAAEGGRFAGLNG